MKEKKESLPIAPMNNYIIVERLQIKSRLEKAQDDKSTDVRLTKEQIGKINKEKLEATKNVLDVWDVHPLQGRIVAIHKKQSKETGLNIGDRIAFRIDEAVGIMSIFNNKKYMCLYLHDILFKYTSEES